MLIILKSAKMPPKIAPMHLFEIQSSKQKSFSFLKWQKLGIRSRDVFICQLMVTDNLFSQQTKF
jgi:hypothetical protein